ncbi:hypothetical protein [Rhodococcus artemisiae]|uniref:DUF4259 domain-containing protein n=1 Tax=Rhodococcus artemisiae TaxID=714159 RepID=A0ABU7LBR9_9NOCA|nr:hypothetical protein [Rhodococcus artemisiae]MEE2058995.1 hypothetical protein [Rhodococcus artemisiae]
MRGGWPEEAAGPGRPQQVVASLALTLARQRFGDEPGHDDLAGLVALERANPRIRVPPLVGELLDPVEELVDDVGSEGVFRLGKGTGGSSE